MAVAPRRSRRFGLRRARSPRGLKIESLELRSLLAADPYISEFLAVNANGLVDEDGEHSDWIEIHNRGDADADLTGWSLTDDAADLGKWDFPATTIPPDGRLIVFASDKDRALAGSQLHTNFKLTGEGEYLALVAADGTVKSHFDPNYPAQRDDTSYGLTAVETVTTLIGPATPGKYTIPTADLDAQIGDTWTGGTSYDDSAWADHSGGIGFDIATSTPVLDGTVAYQISSGTAGNHAFAGSLGMDFVVNRPLSLTALGAFDDGSNGISRTITVQLWSRNDQGSPDNPLDDTGVVILAGTTFSAASPGTLVGGSRFKTLATPLMLQPGAYTIVAFGYGTAERSGTSGGNGGFGAVAATDALSFVGQSRFAAGGSTAFPTSVDLGPANRYAAGTFAFTDIAAPPVVTPSVDEHVAYITTPGVATHTFAGNLGMDFEVVRPIRITELGAFDSGLDGIKGAIGVSLWSRNVNNTQTKLVAIDFSSGEGTLAPGTSSRFLSLDEPLLLQPGQYTINASGFVDEDKYSRANDAVPLNGSVDSADGAVRYVGSSRYATDPNRFTFEPFHRFPNIVDNGPFNKWAAGTFKFEEALDTLFDTDVAAAMSGVNASAYVRLPFDVADPAAFDGLRLKVDYDDGFVAYLNGIEVARRNAPDFPSWNSAATAQRTNVEVFTTESIDLSALLFALQPGQNVLAIHALNAGATNSDFALRATLEATTLGELAERYFTSPTPGDANGQGLSGIVADTSFDINRGFVARSDRDANGQIHVTITTPTAGATIYYTTNGADPTPATGTPYTAPVDIGTTTTLRAAAYKDGYLPTDIDTHTYLFLDDVAHQSMTPEGYPLHWNGDPADYGMTDNAADQAVIANDPNATPEEYEQVIETSLRSLPTMSVVLNPEDMFGPATGIYSNTYPRGEDWERPASVEYILPDGSTGFQANAVLQMMGWTSRIPGVSPKHTLRVVFKDEVGPGRLNYKFFENIDVDSFNTIALRSNSRDAWVSDNGGIANAGNREIRPLSSYVRDQWARDTEAAMGQPSAAGNFVHLYINGMYWGLYNTTERPDASFAEEHFGGAEADYDVLRFCNPSPQIVDGDFTKWNELVAYSDAGLSSTAAFQRIQGNNPDGTRNPDYPVLMDVDSLIDFMIGGYYHAAADWPCNWYAIRDRRDTSEGFKFLQWDNDLAFPFGDLNANTTAAQTFWNSSPGRFDVALRQNPEYRLQFADHVQKHFFNGGALTLESTAARWAALGETVRPALAAEAARWGDYRRDIDPTIGGRTLYTAETYWDQQNEYMLDTFFPLRSSIVLDQLRAIGMYPAVDPPALSQHGGEVPEGFPLEISSAVGTIYYTTDGSDPRSPSSGAITATTLIAESAAKRVLVPSVANGGSALGATWRGGSEPFDDSTWRTGNSGVGYDTNTAGVNYLPHIGINVQDMQNVNGSVFIRVPFTVDAAGLGSFNQLALRMKYDDGFVAFLNGTRIAGINDPTNLTYNALAAAANSDSAAILFQTIDVSQYTSLLHEGVNVLAIQGLNQSLASSDLLIGVELIASSVDPGAPSPTADIYTSAIALMESQTVKARVFHNGVWSALAQAQFSVSNPLRIVELMYNPSGTADDTEFVELRNTGPIAVSLVGVRLAQVDGQGVAYEFLAGDTVESLAPGERIVIAKDRVAFLAAYPTLSGIHIADRDFTGSLDNGGEQLTLLDANDGTIQQFAYDDAWQPTTDGDGFSLVIVNDAGLKDTWNDAASWRASFQTGGSPGEADVMLGDVNGDNQVGLADMIVIQQHLGMAQAARMEDGDLNRDGSVTLADVRLLLSTLSHSYAAPISQIAPGAIVQRRVASSVLPATPAVLPSYVPPTATHGYTWTVVEPTVSLPDDPPTSVELRNPIEPPTAPRPDDDVAPIGTAPAGVPVVPLGGDDAFDSGDPTDANVGATLPVAAQAAAIVDRVLRASSIGAGIRPSRLAAVARLRTAVRVADANSADALSVRIAHVASEADPSPAFGSSTVNSLTVKRARVRAASVAAHDAAFNGLR